MDFNYTIAVLPKSLSHYGMKNQPLHRIYFLMKDVTMKFSI